MEPSLRMTSDFNTNPRLLSTPAEDARGLGADALLQLARRDERDEASVRAGVNVRRYENYELLNADDQRLGVSLAHRFEHARLALDVDAVRDHTLTSELETTGFVETNRRRENYRAGIDFQLRPTERSVLGTRVGYDRTDYARDPLQLLVDYRYPSMSVYAQTGSTERSLWTITARGGALQGGPGVSKARDFALSVGFQSALSEDSQIEVSAGPSLLDPESGKRINGVVFSATYSVAFERNRFRVEALRERRPNGGGALSERTEISASVVHSLSERLSGEVTLRGIRNDDRYGRLLNFSQRRNYARGEAHLSWRVTERWQTDLAYAHSRQRYPGPDLDASAHQINLSAVWTGWRWAE